MRKVFLDDLPRWGKGGKAKEGTINWSLCVGMKVRFIYDTVEGEIEVINYGSKEQKLTVKYLNNNYDIKTSHFLNGKIGKVIGKKTNEFKAEIGQGFKDEQRNLVILSKEYRTRKMKANKKGDVYLKNEKWYRYHCNKCSYNGWMEENCLIYRKHSCLCCSGRVAILGVNTIWDTNRELAIKLGVSEHDAKNNVEGSGKKIEIICPDCGKRKTVIINDIFDRKSIGCICNSDGFSYGHKYIHELLSQLSLNFIDNHKPSWCKYYNKYKNKNSLGEYDFFIEDMKLIIEVDGNFHRKDNSMNGQTKEESNYIDAMKDELANKNGYKIIRIPYETADFKEMILNSDLIRIADLSKIDWLKCEKFALRNLIKEVCNYYKNNEHKTTIDIGKVFGLNRSTVRDYLNKGYDLGLCEYNADGEVKKRISKLINSNKSKLSKKIEIFKNEISLGVFESCNQLERESERLFGVKLNISSISNVANNKRKTHKGFTFKYVD